MGDRVQMALPGLFGDWLRQARQDYGYTQKELGERAICSAALIRKIEAGARRPSRQVAEAILAALEVPVAQRPALLRLALSPPAASAKPSAAGPLDVPGRPAPPALPALLT